VIILIRMSCDKNEIFRQLSFRVDCLNRDIAHERAEKYAAKAEQVALRGRIVELQDKLFNNVMAAKKSGYEDGVAWMQAKLAAAEADTARMPSELHVVFTNFPGPENECVFVEVEDAQGKSLNLGEWRRRADGYVDLVFTSRPEAVAVVTTRTGSGTCG
jgi:hypothetical protein